MIKMWTCGAPETSRDVSSKKACVMYRSLRSELSPGNLGKKSWIRNASNQPWTAVIKVNETRTVYDNMPICTQGQFLEEKIRKDKKSPKVILYFFKK